MRRGDHAGAPRCSFRKCLLATQNQHATTQTCKFGFGFLDWSLKPFLVWSYRSRFGMPKRRNPIAPLFVVGRILHTGEVRFNDHARVCTGTCTALSPGLVVVASRHLTEVHPRHIQLCHTASVSFIDTSHSFVSNSHHREWVESC